MLSTAQDIIELIKNDYEDKTLSELQDLDGEIIDNLLPIYYSEIIKEWQEMPSQYDGQGVAEFGLPAEPTVYNLMTGDLYAYYSATFYEALTELEDDGYFEEEEEAA
jgi:hypothetical protein